jgi:hypothetical protein
MADMNIVIAAHTGAAQSEIARLQAKLKSLDGTMAKSRRGANVYGEAVDANTRGLSKFAKSGLQQTGYQVGDFAVQVGGGTSALQAFGQQGSQLFGIFGAGGAIFGAAIAIVAAVGNAFLKSAEQAKDFGSATEDLAKATADYTRELDLSKIDALQEKYGDLNESTISLINSQRALAAIQQQAEFKKVTKSLTETVGVFDKVIERQRRLTSKTVDFTRPYERLASKFGDSMKSVGKEFGIAGQMLGQLGERLNAVSSSETKDALRDNVALALDFISQNGGATTEKMIELKTSLEQLGISAKVLEGIDVAKLGDDAREAFADVPNMFGLVRSEAEELGGAIATSMGASFKSIIDGTKSTSEAFKSMAASIINQLIDVLIIQQLVGSVGSTSKSGVVTKGTGLAGFFSGTGHAIGGAVQSGRATIVGERGPELFMPHSSGSIVPNNKMGGNGGTTVVQNINISTGVSQTVRAEIAQLMPQIAEASKAAVLDARRRGGSFSKAF